MDDIFSVYIVEDDRAACKRLADAAELVDDITIKGITNNAAKAVEDIKCFLPDALILDLELNEGKGSGLDVLKELKTIYLPVKPYTLVTTNNSSSITYEFARQLGADFIMSKHKDDYSEQAVIDFLVTMKFLIKKNRHPTENGEIPISPELNKKRIERRIIAELNKVGISTKAVGYKYLIDAIQLKIGKGEKNICKTIGEKYGKTEGSVERAMQNAINRAWKSTAIDSLVLHYSGHIDPNRGMPTLLEFIYYYSVKIENEI